MTSVPADAAPVTVPVNSANRYAHIDALRAFSVLLVVVAHAGLGFVVPGGSGVTLFFSISGFIITFLILRERDKTGGFSPRGFYARRVVKILPPFAVAIIIPTLIYAFFHRVDWDAFLAQIFFSFNWFKVTGSGVYLPGAGVVWSLAIEEQFYIVFAIIWLVLVRRAHWRLVLTIIAAIGVVLPPVERAILALDPANTHRIYYGTDTRIDAIAWGVLVAVAYHSWLANGQRVSRAARAVGSDLTLVAAVVVYLLSIVIRNEYFRDTFHYTLQSLAACAIIAYGLVPGGGPLRRAFYAVSTFRPVALIGLASYSIYLVHFQLIALFDLWVGGLPLVPRVVLESLVGIGAGIAVYYLVEKPVQRWYRAWRARREVTIRETL